MDEGRSRVRIFSAIVLIILSTLALRLGKLQLVDSKSHTGKSENNSMREHRVQAPRGRFFDRNGVLMVENEPSYTLYVTPSYFDDSTIPLLANLLNVSDSTIAHQIQLARAHSAFRRSIVQSSLTMAELGRVLEQRAVLGGIDYDITQKRTYTTPAHMTHALGYVREITNSKLGERTDEVYKRGDPIGQSGLELEYESFVRGTTGADYKMVNIKGQVVDDYLRGEMNKAPINGLDLTLTIDADLQAFAESLFVNKRGGVIALDPNTGEVLAMLSAPDYDLDLFSSRLDPKKWNELLNSPDEPLFNRVTQSVLAPGSTFKPMVALMALSAGTIDENYTYYCNGGHPIGRGNFFKCLAKHGSLNVVEALKESCNSFFFEMMRLHNVNVLHDFAAPFGFGSAPYLDISRSEIRSGLLPDSAYFNQAIGVRKWGQGDIMNLGVGQGALEVSPLQLVRYVSAFANDGLMVTPHLVRNMVDRQTGEVTTPEIEPAHRVTLNKTYLDIVKKGMRRVITDESPWLEIPGVTSIGKTGSAQNPRNGKSDALFIMAAPAENPQIAIAVIVENAGFGSGSAGPIGSFMAERYLTGRIDPKRDIYMKSMMSKNSVDLGKN